MNRKFLIATLFSVGIFLFSCKDSKTKEAPEAKKENAAEKMAAPAITDKHVKIPNSSLYIIPPAGFAVDELSGTLAQTNGTAHYMQMQILAGYTTEKLLADFKSGADKDFPGSWKEEAVTVSGQAATIYSLKNAAYSQYILVFSGVYADAMVLANYEESEGTTGKAMYDALKTVVAKK